MVEQWFITIHVYFNAVNVVSSVFEMLLLGHSLIKGTAHKENEMFLSN